MDAIYGWILVIGSWVFLFIVIIYIISVKDDVYSNHYKFYVSLRKYGPIALLGYVNLLGLFAMIFPLQTRIYIIIQYLLTISSLILFLVDVLYFKKLQNNLLIDYMNVNFKKFKLYELFDIRETMTKFETETDTPGKNVVIVIEEGRKLLMFKNGNVLLIPKYDYTEKEYKYLENFINYHLDYEDLTKIAEIPFEFEKDTKLYKYFNTITPSLKYSKVPEKIEDFVRKNYKKFLIVISVSLLLIVNGLIGIFEMAKSFGWENILDFYKKISDWLFL